MTVHICRRRLLASAISLVSCNCPLTRSLAQESGTGCWIPDDEADSLLSNSDEPSLFETGEERLEPRSGDARLDRALAQALAKIARTFGVLPAFAYYDDSGSPNARATPQSRLDRADGTVLFGLSLLDELKRTERPDAAIMAVCAHEFGHIASYKNGMIAKLAPGHDPFRAEQFADYMAGYYAGTRRLQTPSFPAAVFATTQRKFGGGDHGTGTQRGEAVQEGYLTAYRRQMDVESAKSEALKFALARINEA